MEILREILRVDARSMKNLLYFCEFVALEVWDVLPISTEKYEEIIFALGGSIADADVLPTAQL